MKKYIYHSHTPGHVAIVSKETGTTKVIVKGKAKDRKTVVTKVQDVVLQKGEEYELPEDHAQVKALVSLGYLTEVKAPVAVATSTTPVKPDSEVKPNGTNATEVK